MRIYTCFWFFLQQRQSASFIFLRLKYNDEVNSVFFGLIQFRSFYFDYFFDILNQAFSFDRK